MAMGRHAAARVLSLLPKAAPDFTLTKHPPQLLAPKYPTPHQSLYLSNIDDQLGLRCQVPLHLFYPSNNKKNNEKDPVKVIKEALAKVLVHYYPFAGRLREADNGKLRVDCTGEGILLVEADADIYLEDFGDLYPPIPRGDDFIQNVPGSETITDSPLLLIQVVYSRAFKFVESDRN